MKIIEPEFHLTLDDYSAVADLGTAAEALRTEARRLVPALRGKTIWMVNSTARGGGVAEILPPQIALLRQLGVHVNWAVIEGDRPFFEFTKRLHNLIHGERAPHPNTADRELYEAVSRASADELAALVAPGDIVVIHDPQPLLAGALLAQTVALRTIWRCHIGIDEENAHTKAAWRFLKPYAQKYDRVVFSLPEYVPKFLRTRSSIIHPSIDPLGHKNRLLLLHKLIGIMCDSDLAVAHWPLLAEPFEQRAVRLRPDGSFAPASAGEDIGLLARPVITQVSRWDHLKGFAPLMAAFRLLKRDGSLTTGRDARHQRRLEIVRLVLAGPDPAAIQDDPEALSVLNELVAQYVAMEPAVQQDVALIALPMASLKNNALMVNALQRCSDIVVQNSLREGFGLTVAEAMWKHAPVLGSARACGVRMQVRDDVDGRLASDPEDVPALARLMADMLADENQLEEWGRNAQQRAQTGFLIFTELQAWLRLLSQSDRGGH